MKKIRLLLRIWRLCVGYNIQNSLASKLGASFFIVAKLLRFSFFVLTLFYLLEHTTVLAEYGRQEILLLFLTFTFVDSATQLLFREVYRFRPKIVSGDFDYELLKPLPALFRPLLGGFDIFDAATLVPYTVGLIVVAGSFSPTPAQAIAYLYLVFNAIVIAGSFHILVLALGVVTTEIDHTLMIYRDLTSMGRFPMEMYNRLVQGVLTYLIPIGLMVTLPTQALIRLFQWDQLILAGVVSLVFLLLSLVYWKRALLFYTSASS